MTTQSLKLWLVTCRGMTSSGISSGDRQRGICYVIALDPTAAYNAVREYLDKEDLGFRYERELESIKLIADTCEYAPGPSLFLADRSS